MSLALAPSTSEEFIVNTYTDNEQWNSSVASFSDGGFVVTWNSNDQNGDDYYGIFGQRYNADGTTNGNEFQINTHTDLYQMDSSVASLSDGGFVVTWSSKDQDGDYYGIFGQRYNADGTVNGNEFQINTYIDDGQYNSSVASLSDSGFVVTWQSFFQDGDYHGIFGQRYNADGTANGDEFQINTYTDNSQRDSSVASLSDSGFIVTWESKGQDGDDYYGIFGQRYNADGTVNGNEFQINTYTDGHQNYSSVTSLSDGGFVVTWNSYDQDGNSYGIFGQRYNADGTANGDEFQINTCTDSSQYNSSVTSLSDGGFVVTWESYNQDGDAYGIFGQRYNADGTNNGDEFQINDYNLSNQIDSSVTALSNGSFVVTWDSYDQDGSNYSIAARIFTIDTQTGTFGDDVLKGNDYVDDVIYGLNGQDKLYGKDGDDILYGDLGDDYLRGGAGNDTLYGGGGNDTLYGDAGNDYLDGGDGEDIIKGGNGDDLIDGNNGADRLYGGAGNDFLCGSTGNDILKGGADNDWLYGGAGNDTLYGNAGKDYLDGDEGDDVLKGGGGHDVLLGRLGDDTLYGEDGDDYLDGEDGDDILKGGEGEDALYGGDDNDTLYGENGDDYLDGEDDNDILKGGNDNDTLYGGAGNDTLYGENGNDYLDGEDGDDILKGGDENDVLLGGLDDDTLYGETGGDYLGGNEGNDSLKGGSGYDILEGGEGSDRLEGGSEGDLFLFFADAMDGNMDRIVDFSTTENDVIEFDKILIDYDPLSDAISDFITLKETSINTYIKVDADGNGTDHEAQYLVRVEGITGQWSDAQDMIDQGDLVIWY